MYYIEKDKFIECLRERISDFEYYHELKSKIDLSTNPEMLEVPMLESSRHHFNPTKTAIIKKYCRNNEYKTARIPSVRLDRLYFRGKSNLVSE